jgi:hypothetical protein
MNETAPLDRQMKLPQARLYLKSARWGIDQLIGGKLIDDPFRFYIIGILASLRAVQHALRNHDAKISPEHHKLIDEWWNDPRVKESADLIFIKTARDLILKEGSFKAYATLTESSIGEGQNYTVTGEDYDLGYWIDGKRYPLLPAMQNAIAWCERELASIEAKIALVTDR